MWLIADQRSLTNRPASCFSKRWVQHASGEAGLADSHQVLNLVDVHDAASGLPSADGLWRQFFFDFRFGKSCHGRKRNSRQTVAQSCSASLPSSLDVRKDANATSTRVRYEIQAWAFHGDTVRAAISQEIRLFDSACVAPPPVIVEHFPGEFSLRQEKKVSRGMMRPVGKIAVAVAEPPAAEIQHGGSLVQTKLPVRLELSDQTGLPKRLDLRVKSTLHGTTFVSSERMEEMPSCQCVVKSGAVQEAKTKARSFTQKLSVLCRWQMDPKGSWWQDVVVPLPLVADQTPPPTFTSPLVARRYSVSVQIGVTGGANATFDLKVPVHVMYSGDEREELSRVQTRLSGVPIQNATAHLEEPNLQPQMPSEPLPLYVR